MRALLLAALAAAFTTACASPPAPISTGPVTAIAFEMRVRGALEESWSIDDAGRATLARRAATAGPYDPVEPQTYTLTPADFASVRDALEPARANASSLSCEDATPDAAAGHIEWTHADAAAHHRILTGCGNTSARTTAFNALAAADAIMHERTGVPH